MNLENFIFYRLGDNDIADLFEAIKATVSLRAAAKRYGLEVNPAGMLQCPFHDDHTPSMKLYDDHFYCFGCNQHGDVISLTAAVLGITPQEAVQKLADDFAVSAEAQILPLLKAKAASKDKSLLYHCRHVLATYYRLLKQWYTQYAPISLESVPGNRFAGACKMLDTVNALTNELFFGSQEEQKQAVNLLLECGMIDWVEARLKFLSEEQNDTDKLQNLEER